MKTRYDVSPWIDEVPRGRRPDYPRLRGEWTADVVVMGGGVTGCATAYAAAASGLKTVLVDADRIGQASTGQSAGLLVAEPGPSFRDVAARYGLKVARRIFTEWRRASIDAAAQLRRLGIRGSLEQHQSLDLAAGLERARLEKEQAAREEAGLEARWLRAKQVRAVTGSDVEGMQVPDAFSLQPYAVCLGLAAAAVEKKAMVAERSAVRKVRVGQKAIEVIVDGGLVRAGTLVVATGTATAEFKPLRRHFTECERYLVLTEKVPPSMQKHFGARAATYTVSGVGLTGAQGSPKPQRLVWARDRRLLIAGGDQAAVKRQRDSILVQRTGQLMYELLLLYPAIVGLHPEYGWSVPYGQTADGLMFIGPHRNYPRHLFALGSAGDSLTGAFLAARILTRALHGAPERGDDDLGWTSSRLS